MDSPSAAMTSSESQRPPDGSLGGQRYLDRGVDEPSLYAPFGSLQGIDLTE